MDLFLVILKSIGYVLAGWVITVLPLVFTIFLIIFEIKRRKNKKNNLDNKNNIINQVVINILGILVANIELFLLVVYFDVFSYINFLIILLFTSALILIVVCKAKKEEKVILIIQRIAVILVIIVPFTVSIYHYVYEYNNPYINKTMTNNEAQAQNSKFENYFGTDVTAQEVKNLLSEIRTNNLTASRNEELATIGVCFISKNIEKSEEEKGIYRKDSNEIDPATINRTTLNTYNFSADVDNIKNLLKENTSYTVNTPNTRTWKIGREMLTGFEKDGNPMGQPTFGEYAYYPYGYIRLIYIIDNANRSPQGAKNY